MDESQIPYFLFSEAHLHFEELQLTMISHTSKISFQGGERRNSDAEISLKGKLLKRQGEGENTEP